MATMHKNQVEDWLANVQAMPMMAPEIDANLPHEVHTDKAAVKLVGCRECKRPMVVTTFFAPAKAQCKVCKGEGPAASVATVGVPIPGQTDPAKAVDLATTLINRTEFEVMLCPFGHGDMELKSVNHNDHHGPGHYNPKGHWVQDDKGETVMHQCNECMCVISMTTTATHVFKRQNEARTKLGRGADAWADTNGIRDENEQEEAA